MTANAMTKQEAQLIADVYKLLPEELPGFISRQQQKDMISFSARGLAYEQSVVVEAPTGTGKSFGYQIPGIVLALSRDRRFVMSTETANLQDQIANSDLIVLTNILKKLGMEAPSVVCKGRERYICPLRLEEKSSQASLIDGDESNGAMSKIADAWDADWDGQRDSLPFRVPNAIWMKVNNNRHACTNDRCPKAKECPHMEMKAKLKTARIIITNHSYLLANIAVSAISEGPKNPVVDFEKNYYAFDEAHHLHSRCIEAFASKALIDEEILHEAGRMLAGLGANPTLAKLRGEAMHGIGIALRTNIHTMVGDKGMHRFTLGEVPAVMAELVEEYASALKVVIDLMGDAIEDASKGDQTRASTVVLIGNAKAVMGQMEEMHTALIDFTASGGAPRARWVDAKKDMCTVYVAPFEAAGLANAMLWKVMKGAVLTSATIAALGDFAPTLAALGLPRDTPTLRLSSPLNYDRARIIVPKLMVDANSAGHGSMGVSILRKQLFAGEHKAGLMYFTSRKKMETVFASLTPEEQACVVLQGALSPSAMVAEHKRRIDAGNRSIMFGLDSIAEGVNLPGIYCTLVVIDKLPFPSPDDPILASHAEHLESKGLHPFPLLMLPIAALKLAQVVGRLIRTETDWGDCWVLDRRIVEKSYGKRLLNSTPFQTITQM